MNDVVEYIENSNFKLIGITGSAGSGKTTLASRISSLSSLVVYSADTRFIGDSNFRKTLLKNKAQNSIASYIDAVNQMSWWNFDLVLDDLKALKSGQDVNIINGYNRDSGKICESYIIHGGPRAIYEGAILGHNQIVELLDKIIFVHTPQEVRLQRLIKKDSGRRTLNEILARFFITEYSETQHYKKLFNEFWDRIVVVDENYNFSSMHEKWLNDQQYIPLMV